MVIMTEGGNSSRGAGQVENRCSPCKFQWWPQRIKYIHTHQCTHRHTHRQKENHSYRDDMQEVGKHLRASISFLWGRVNILHVKLWSVSFFPFAIISIICLYFGGVLNTVLQWLSNIQVTRSFPIGPAHLSILPSMPPLALFHQQDHPMPRTCHGLSGFHALACVRPSAWSIALPSFPPLHPSPSSDLLCVTLWCLSMMSPTSHP